MNRKYNILGYDIGGTKIAVGLISSDGTVLGSARIPNRDSKPEVVLPQMVETGAGLIREAGLDSRAIHGIGIASPSPADIANGIIVAPTNNKYWHDVPIRQYLSEQFKVEAFFENDANAGALAEWMFGAGRGCDNMLYLTMSSGIGGGLIVNGRLVKGANHYAGEVGHMVLEPEGIPCSCGAKGCYEAYCGGHALARRMQQELKDKRQHPIVEHAGGDLKQVDLLCLEKAARDGDEYALRLWDEMCRRNAQVYGMLVNLLNPDKIILGTLAWAAGDLFMEPVLKYLPRFAWEQPLAACSVLPAALKRDIGIYAGPAVALNALYERGDLTGNSKS